MSKVLCVDDDANLTDLLRYGLTREGYTVLVANRAREALQIVKAAWPDAIILDLNLPDLDGLTLCARLRALSRSPIIMLTARRADEEMMFGFAEGADDYITKPFNMQVLIYRLRVALRRTQAEQSFNATSNETYRLGDGSFYADRNEIISSRSHVRLTPIEGKILRLLLDGKGRVLPLERIMERVWGYETESDAKVIRTHVHHLRSKLARAVGDLVLVQTVPGIGYTLSYTPTAPAGKLAGAAPNCGTA